LPKSEVKRLGGMETNGSSPLAAFVSGYDDVSPDFPHQLAGVARASNGAAIGGVMHQFRDTADGFHARLTVEFPSRPCRS
jgi:hypothetical protein